MLTKRTKLTKLPKRTMLTKLTMLPKLTKRTSMKLNALILETSFYIVLEFLTTDVLLLFFV
jgi:hypothetical protein